MVEHQRKYVISWFKKEKVDVKITQAKIWSREEELPRHAALNRKASLFLSHFFCVNNNMVGVETKAQVMPTATSSSSHPADHIKDFLQSEIDSNQVRNVLPFQQTRRPSHHLQGCHIQQVVLCILCLYQDHLCQHYAKKEKDEGYQRGCS